MQWHDKLVYLLGGLGAFIGSAISSMNILGIISLVSMLAVTLVNIVCQVVRTLNDVKTKRGLLYRHYTELKEKDTRFHDSYTKPNSKEKSIFNDK